MSTHPSMTPGHPEHLVVYGVRCVWWDGIEKAGRLEVGPQRYDTPARAGRPGLPYCPHCGSVLMQTEETKWWKGAKDYEDGLQPDGEKHPGYVAMMTWSRGRCFPGMAQLRAAYEARDRPS